MLVRYLAADRRSAAVLNEKTRCPDEKKRPLNAGFGVKWTLLETQPLLYEFLPTQRIMRPVQLDSLMKAYRF